MDERIILDLYESLNARAFDEKSSFYRSELERAVARVKESLKVLGKAVEDKENKATYEKTALHSHEALGILGERGTGKTSFILSLCRRLESENELRKRLYFLPVVDPTLLENSERLLVTVISNIIDEVEGKEGLNRFSEKEEKYQETKSWLARALRVILRDSPHLKELATEPEIFAAEALRDAESGAKLAQYFRDFCTAALNLLGKDFFVLPIDDIDMMLSQGYEVLETIRKYLSHDKILIILSGYFPLYRDIARASFFKQLLGAENSEVPEEVPEIFERNKEYLLRRIDDLTIQYLLKIMPAYNRIELKGVNRKIWKEEMGLDVRGKNEINFQDLWRRFCEELFFLPREVSLDILDPQKYSPALILPFSARGFINFVKILDEYYQEGGSRPFLPEDSWNGLLEIYISNFFKLGLEELREHLRYLPGSSHLGTLAALLFEHREALGPNYWLLEPPGDPFSREGEDLRQLYLLIQSGINQLFRKQPFYMLDFANRFSLTQEIISQIPLTIQVLRQMPPEIVQNDENRIRTILRDYNKVEDTLGYLLGLVLNKNRPLNAGALFLTKRRQRYGENKTMNTMVPYAYVVTWEDFYRKDHALPFQKLVFRHLHQELAPRIQNLRPEVLESPDLFPAVENWEARADNTARWLLYCFSALYYPRKAEAGSYWTVSFFRALAYLQNLLEKELPEDMQVLRNTLSLDVPFYPLEGAIEETEEEGKIEEEEAADQRPSPDEEWVKAIQKWWKWARNELQKEDSILPSSVLSQAAHRFYDNLRALSDELALWERNLGFVLSRWILASWQALLVEEYAFRTGKRENVKRIIRGEGVFAKREERRLSEFLGQAKFSPIFIYCPIFLGLVEENVRNRLIQQEEAPVFLRKFSFKVSYELRDLRRKLSLPENQAIFKGDPYTLFSALTVSIPSKAPKVTLTREKFLEHLAQNLVNAAFPHAGD